MAPNLQERVGVAEVEIDHLEEKIDEVQANLREFRTEITHKLEDMQAASTKQHRELGEKIADLEKIKDKWIYLGLGGLFVIELVSKNWDLISKLMQH